LVFDENLAIIERMARVSKVRFVSEISSGLAKHSTTQFDVAVVYERKIDAAAERKKINKEIARLEKITANSGRQLNNPGFVEQAPAHIVGGLKKQLEEARQLLDKLRKDLDSLPPE
jgi:valyl-tRNA synthetase